MISGKRRAMKAAVAINSPTSIYPFLGKKKKKIPKHTHPSQLICVWPEAAFPSKGRAS